MITHINYQVLGLLSFVALAFALFAGTQLLLPTVSEAIGVSTSTVHLIMQKNISGPAPTGYTADDFSFNVSGNGVNQNLTISDLGTGFYSSPLQLVAGTYTITEMGPTGWVPAEWTVLWAGECNKVTEFTASFVVNSGNMGDGNQYCSAENQYRPGVLKVEKKFASSTTPVPFENFTFKVTQGTVTKFEGTFESDGNNSVNIGKGAYIVTENPISGYTASYSAGCSGTINNSENKTCTITNTYTGTPYAQGSYGGGYSQSSYYAQSSYGGGNGDGSKGTLLVTKVIVGTTSVPLSNFSFTYTGATGNTAFELDGTNRLSLATGTYSITEVAALGYTTTYSNCSGIVVTAGATTTACVITNTLTQGGGGGSYSQGSYGGGSGSYSQGSYGGGGGGNSNSNNNGSGGGSNNSSNNGSGGGNGNSNSNSNGNPTPTPTPTPKILGEATTAMPLGAANTGAGGASPLPLSSEFHGMLAILTIRKAVQVTNGK